MRIDLPRLVLASLLAMVTAGCATTAPRPPEAPPSAPLKTELNEQEQQAFVLDYAQLLISSGHHGEARKLLEQLRGSDPGNPQVLELLARVYEQEGKSGMALVAWQQVQRTRPDNRADAAELARVALMNERYDIADAVFRRWLAEAAPGSRERVAALNNLGYSELLQGKFERAIYHLQEALELDPLNRRVRSNLALAYELIGHTEQAQAQLRLLGAAN